MTSHTSPTDLSLHQSLSRGVALLRGGRYADAAELGSTLARLHPEQSHVLAFAADAYEANGDLPGALSWINEAIACDSASRHKIKKAWLLSDLLRRDEIPALAEQILEQARRGSGDGLLFWQLARLYYLHNHLREAIDCYQLALQIEDRPDWRYNLALARFYAGETALAEADLDELLALAPQAGTSLYLRSVLRKQKPDDNHVADIRSRLDTGFRKAENEAAALYALAKELEDLGEHDESFRCLVAGAKKKRSTLQYDVSAVTDALYEIRAFMDEAAIAAPAAGHDEIGAIFVVGMPRTGTTLAQRLLMQSGEVSDAGELMDFSFHLTAAMERVRRTEPQLPPALAALKVDFAELGRKYMLGARQMAGGGNLFIDKLPANYMYCGMIHKALPNAKIIHLERDPLDSCYAIFKTLFFSAYDFSYDQEELAEYYIAYREVMRHWHDVMPGRILDVRYEDLVTDTEAEAKRIYDWCGLKWTPEALAVPDARVAFSTASAAQVREPVHARSIDSSRRHLNGLRPMLDKLVAAGLMDSSSATGLGSRSI